MTLHLVTMCTHNRTRSVLMGALLGEHLRADGIEALIASVGLTDEGEPPTEPTVRLLAERGIDVSNHRSTFVHDELVARADLVVTAEVEHVVFVSGRWQGLFPRTFTLPELVQRGEAMGPRRSAPLGTWLAEVGQGRPTGYDYLSDPFVPEVADPTGHAPVVWKAAFAEIDDLCARLARLLA